MSGYEIFPLDEFRILGPDIINVNDDKDLPEKPMVKWWWGNKHNADGSVSRLTTTIYLFLFNSIRNGLCKAVISMDTQGNFGLKVYNKHNAPIENISWKAGKK